MKLARAATPALLSLALVAGCQSGNAASGGGTAASGGQPTSSAPAVAGGASAPAASDAASACPTSNTRSWAKTRFAADVGLAIGSFHHWIWKPYKAGTFKKGAHGRIRAIIKGVATAALDAKLMDNALKNVKANPTLCKALSKPMSEASGALKDLKGKITSGDLASLTSTEGLLAGIMKSGNDHGLGIKESTDTSQASAG